MATLNFFKISKFFLYAALFSVVLVSTETLFPFIVVKYTFFRVTVGFSLISFLFGLLFLRPEEEKKMIREILNRLRQPLVLAVSIFILVFILAGLFGFNPHYSFWSNFERGEGGFQLLAFYFFFLLSVLLFTAKKDWLTAFKTSLGVAGGVILYGILAGLGLEGFIGVPLSIGQRFQGSLGNTAYVGTYMLFSIFYALYFLVSDWKNKRFIIKVILTLFVLGFLTVLWLTQTRGPFLGLGAGILAFLIFLVFNSPGRLRKFGLIALFTVVVFGASLYQFREAPLMQRLALTRFFNITLNNLSTQSRFWSWQAALEGWQEKPILGWGPENFGRLFDKHFDTRHFIPNESSDTWYDRAHNVLFDYLSETGVLGLSSYLAIFVVFFVQFLKRRRELQENITGKALIFAVPFAYLMQGLVIFDVLPIYLNLFLFLAFANYKFHEANS